MSIGLDSYLNFNGNCEEAMNFYKNIFGGDVEISRFSDFPDAPDGYADKVMHSTLKTDGFSFMASDGVPGREVTYGDGVNMSLSGDDQDVLTNYFNGLAEGGTTTVPLEMQMWGDIFGMLTDKFGIHWLVNISTAKNDVTAVA